MSGNRKYRGPLTADEIKRIRDRRADGVSVADIASSFRVGHAAVTAHTSDIQKPDLAFRRPTKSGLTRSLRRYAAARR